MERQSFIEAVNIAKDFEITADGVPGRVEKCMEVDKRADEFRRVSRAFSLLSLYRRNMLHVRSLALERKTSRRKCSLLPRCVSCSRSSDCNFYRSHGSVRSLQSYGNLHSNVSHRHFGLLNVLLRILVSSMFLRVSRSS